MRASAGCFRARLAAAAAAAVAAALAQDADTVTLNFVNADIDAVVKAVAEITGRNFVLDPRVKGTINIVSARPVPKSLVYPTLLSALRMQGFTAVEGDGIVKIVPKADAKLQGGRCAAARRGGGDRLITQVITLHNESAAQLVNVLRPLISPNNTIAAIPRGQRARHHRLRRQPAADRADRRVARPGAGRRAGDGDAEERVRARHRRAGQPLVRRNRRRGTPGGRDTSQRVSLVADPRSNSVLIRSDSPTRAARVKALIEQLDTPQRAGGNMFIVYLKNADAARIAETLRGLLAAAAAATAYRPPSRGAADGHGRRDERLVHSVGGRHDAARRRRPHAPAGVAALCRPASTIQADVANNALIIMAPEPIYNNLRAIIEKLDVRRAQVYVEALIVEVTADRAARIRHPMAGVDGRSAPHGIQGIGGTNFGVRGRRQQHRRRVDQPRQPRAGPQLSASSTARSPSPGSASSATSAC